MAGRDADRERGRAREDSPPGGTLGDPFQEFYKPPYETQYDVFGNPIPGARGRVPSIFGGSGGGGGGGGFGGNEGFDANGNFIGDTTYTSTAGGAAPASGAAAGGALTTAQKLMALASVLANIEAGRAGGRVDAGNANATQANAEANIFRTRMVSALTGPRSSAQDAAFGDTLANVQPFSWTGTTHQVGNIPVPDSTGGLSPANFGPNTRAAGRDLSALGASRVTSPAFNLPDPPTIPGLPQANGLDTGLSAGSTIASLLSLYNTFFGSGSTSSGTRLPRTLSRGGSGLPVEYPYNYDTI